MNLQTAKKYAKKYGMDADDFRSPASLISAVEHRFDREMCTRAQEQGEKRVSRRRHLRATNHGHHFDPRNLICIYCGIRKWDYMVGPIESRVPCPSTDGARGKLLKLRRSFNLLPCPFCGGKAVFRAANVIHCRDTVNCCAKVELGDHGPRTAEFAAESWNRRVSKTETKQNDHGGQLHHVRRTTGI